MSIAIMLVFWGLAAWGFVSPRPVLLFLLFATLPFGAFAVLPIGLTGGLTFTAAPVIALLIVTRTLVAPGGPSRFLTVLLKPHRLLLLFSFWAVAVVATLFLPRLFAGDIEVIPVRGILSRPDLLLPTTQSLSQLAYLTISVFLVAALAITLRRRAARQTALSAITLGGAMVVATGALDFASQLLPLDPILSAFRNGSYALAVDVVVLGGKRVVGLMPEASAYGSVSLAFLTALYLLRRGVADPLLRDRIIPPLLAALVVCVWLSKSTGAYVGLALLTLVAALEWLQRAAVPGGGGLRRLGLMAEFWLAFTAVMGALVMIAAAPGVLQPLFELVDRMVFAKATSASFEERGLWRSVAWHAFLDSGGLGIGVGATRASSAVVSTLASVGVLGSALLGAFIFQTLSRRAAADDPAGAAIVSAVRWGFWPGFVVGFFVGSVDFGVLNAALFGLATAVGLCAKAADRSALHRGPDTTSERFTVTSTAIRR